MNKTKETKEKLLKRKYDALFCETFDRIECPFIIYMNDKYCCSLFKTKKNKPRALRDTQTIKNAFRCIECINEK